MKVGIALNMLSEPGRSDVAVVSDHLAMGDLAEPPGFDSPTPATVAQPATKADVFAPA